MNTQEKFLHFIQSQHLFRKKDRILLAVSGGVDSMVMCQLFLEAGFQVGIAHVNFKLRGEDSDGDEAFVKKFAEDHELPFFSTTFSTKKLAEEQKKSIQLIARELRYHWMEEVRKQNGFNYIATAHHLNDSLETILYNWAKGTGIKGMLGIPCCNGFIVRPLLGLTKEDIEAYADTRRLAFRKDASNDETYYSRNKIRHQVIPALKDINPRLEESVGENLGFLQDVYSIYYWAVVHLLKKVWKGGEESTSIDFEKLSQWPGSETLLFEWLSPMGFNSRQVAQVWKSRHNQPGAVFYSDTHQLLIDRTTFVLQKRIEKNNLHLEYTLSTEETSVQLSDGRIVVEHLSNPPTTFAEDANTAFLDASAMTFPLTIRRWRAGDHFCPLGMNKQTKKLQDFFTDLKLPKTEKEKVWIVEDAEKRICWIAGLRLDERFKITPQTRTVVKLIYEP